MALKMSVKDLKKEHMSDAEFLLLLNSKRLEIIYQKIPSDENLLFYEEKKYGGIHVVNALEYMLDVVASSGRKIISHSVAYPLDWEGCGSQGTYSSHYLITIILEPEDINLKEFNVSFQKGESDG